MLPNISRANVRSTRIVLQNYDSFFRLLMYVQHVHTRTGNSIRLAHALCLTDSSLAVIVFLYFLVADVI